MYRLSFPEYIGRKLGECRCNTEHTGEYVQVKTPAVNGLQEEDGPFFNKAEITAEGKIGEGVLYQQEAEKSYRYPEQRRKKIMHALLQGELSAVEHEVGLLL